MAKLFEASKQMYADLNHFKEVAVRTLTETYGAFERIDFSVHEETYKAVGYVENEIMPLEQKAGELLSEVQTEAGNVADKLADEIEVVLGKLLSGPSLLAEETDKFCLFVQQLAPVKDKANDSSVGQS